MRSAPSFSLSKLLIRPSIPCSHLPHFHPACESPQKSQFHPEKRFSSLGMPVDGANAKFLDFYRNDLQWLCDVLMRVDAGERDLLRPIGE